MVAPLALPLVMGLALAGGTLPTQAGGSLAQPRRRAPAGRARRVRQLIVTLADGTRHRGNVRFVEP